MPELSDIRERLADNLASIDGLQESPRFLANPTPPAAEVVPGPTEYDRAFQRGLDEWRLIVRVMVGNTSDVGAQKLLDTFLASEGAKSVKAAIESDRTLGGVVDHLQVERCSGYRVYRREGGGSLLGAEWTVRAIA